MNDTAPLFASKKRTAHRYDVHPKTIDRWILRRGFPAPSFTTGSGNGKREYWAIDDLIVWERRIKVAAA